MADSRYRYTFCDLRSRAKLGSLPLYGVSASDLLVQPGGGANAGMFTGSVRMDADFSTPEEILEITRPEATSVWMDRDGHPLWGGILWSRTYQSDGRALQLNAQTFSSYPSSVVWWPEVPPATGTFSLTQNPHNVIRYVYEYLANEASPEYDIGIELEDFHQDGDPVLNPDLFMTQDFILLDKKYLQDYLSEALKRDAEYRVRVRLNELGYRVAVLETGRAGTLGVPAMIADEGEPYKYPGDMSKFWLTNSSANAPTRLFAIGRTQGTDDISTVVQGSTTNRIGIDKVETYDTNNMTALTALGQQGIADLQGDLNRPVYEIQGENIDLNWVVGDRRRVIIDDPYRFPSRMSGIVRLVGWQFQPSGSDGNEQLSVTIDEVSQLVAI